MHEIDKTPYTDLEKLEDVDPSVKQSNASIVKDVMKKLTPLVEIIAKIDKLLNFSGHNLFDGFFYRYSPHTMKNYFMSMKKTLTANGIQFEPETWRALIHKDVWMPFGEETDDKGQLILNANFNNAVTNATSAATVIIAAIMQKQMQEEGEEAMDVSIDDVPAGYFEPDMVQLDAASAQCMYVYDESRSPPFAKAEVGPRYKLSLLFCLTPSGLVRDLTESVDFIIHMGQLKLNPTNVKQISFRLTRESRDHPRVTLFSTYDLPFNDAGVTEPLHLYIPQNQQNVAISISYHSEYVDMQLPSVTASHLRPDTVIDIDPNSVLEQFATDMRNVNLHADLQLSACPMEQLVSARVNFPQFTEPICSFLDDLFISTASMDDSVSAKTHSKIPYIYSINMQTMECTRTQIMRHELDYALPLMPVDEFARLNEVTTPDGLNIEQHLIRYTMFQMMLSYRKVALDDFLTCPVHHVIFDVYLRRGAGNVGYHYDLTPGNIVSSVGLLYSMPPGHVKVGPQLIPRRYRTDGIISETNVVPMSAFVMRNSAILFNNATYSHTTPDVEHFLSRTSYDVTYEVRNQNHDIIYHTLLHVTHDPITIPASIREKLMESSVNPSRTFLRSWHIVDISQAQRANLGNIEHVAFPSGMRFAQMAHMILLDCFEWLRTTGCMCVEVKADATTGEIIPPTKLPGHLRGGRIMMSAAPKLRFGSPKTRSKVQSKTQYSSSQRSKMMSPIRASTLSISHLKQQIGSKLKKIRAVLKNPKKNVVVMLGQKIKRTRSHSHTHHAPKKRGHTRKVRSAI
jgi:hypothetical protein